MPRPSRAAKNSKTTPPDPQSSSPIDTQTPELQSTETQQAGPELAFNTAKTKQKKRKAGQEDHTDDEFPSREKSRKKMAAKISPLAFRNKGMKMLVGAHVSVAKGLEKVPLVRTTGILISFLENRGSERNHKQSQHWGKRIRNVPQIAQKMDQSGSERIWCCGILGWLYRGRDRSETVCRTSGWSHFWSQAAEPGLGTIAVSGLSVPWALGLGFRSYTSQVT